MNYFISDLHFCHINVLRFNAEQADKWREHNYQQFRDMHNEFISIEQYNEALISRWNTKVKDDDNVYVLGDCGIGSFTKIVECLRRLKGHKHLIFGNHDFRYKNKPEFTDIFDSLQQTLVTSCTVNGENVTVFMSHLPVFDWDQKCRGYVHLYGHVHNAYAENSEFIKSLYRVRRLKGDCNSGMAINVGSMMPYMDFTPRTLEEIYNNEIFQSIASQLRYEALKEMK